MKVALVYPPKVSFQIPPYSLAIAAAVLMKQGFEIESVDLNIESLHWLLSEKPLEYSYENTMRFYQKLNRASKLSPEHFVVYKKAALSLSRKNDFFGRMSEAKHILRTPKQFFDAHRYKWAIELIEQALDLHAVAHYPTRMVPNFRMRHNYQDVRAIEIATRDAKGNPYLPFFREIGQRFAQEFFLMAICVVHPSQVIPAFTLARVIKEKNPALHITVFGNLGDEYSVAHLTNNPLNDDWHILSKFFDSVIVYDAEDTLCKLAQAQAEGTSLNFSDTNLVLLESGIENLKKNHFVLQDLESLPTPYFDGLPLNLYLSPYLVLPYRLSRGCAHACCTFCAIHSNHLGYRSASPAKIVHDLFKLNKRYEARHFHFHDEFVSASLLEQISDAIGAAKLQISWSFRSRPEVGLSKKVLKKARQAGAQEMWLGIESGSSRTLLRMGKNTDLSVNREILHAAQEVGLGIHVLCIIGFPQETVDDARKTFLFLKEHKDCYVSFSLNPFHLYQGSIIARQPNSFQVKIIDQLRLLTHQLQYECLAGMSISKKHQLATNYTGELEKGRPRFFNYHVHRRLYNERFGNDWQPDRKLDLLFRHESQWPDEESRLVFNNSIEFLSANFSLREIDAYLCKIRYITAYAESELDDELQKIQRDTPPLMADYGILIYNNFKGKYVQLLSKAYQRFKILQKELLNGSLSLKKQSVTNDPFIEKLKNLNILVRQR